MKFIVEPMPESINFGLGDTWSLIVQDPIIFRNTIELIRAYVDSREQGLQLRIISEDDQLLDIPKSVLIIQDSYMFDLSSRTITTALIKELTVESTILNEKLLAKVNEAIQELMGEAVQQSEHNIIYNQEVSIGEVAKFMGVRLSANEQYGLVDRMYSIIEVARTLLAKHLVIFIGHRSLISSEEFVVLTDFSKHIGQSVLFIDNSVPETAKSERRIMIDKDLYCYEQEI
jgi:CRISPR type II-A-associated protein Csn2